MSSVRCRSPTARHNSGSVGGGVGMGFAGMVFWSRMTKVEIHFQLTTPLDDKHLEAIARAHTIYGIHRIKMNSTLDSIMVEYDASRLRPPQVEAALFRAGIKAVRREPQLA